MQFHKILDNLLDRAPRINIIKPQFEYIFGVIK